MPAEEAFSEFYAKTARPLWTYIYRVIGNAADADDLAQEAFCRLLCAKTWEFSEEERRRYVFRIAGNLMADRWRRSVREQSCQLPLPGPAQPLLTSTDSEVSLTFTQLKPRDRAILWLAYVERADHKQIADSLGLSRASVKVLLFRARARLRDLLTLRGITTRDRV